jgi:hypothetical protein
MREMTPERLAHVRFADRNANGRLAERTSGSAITHRRELLAEVDRLTDLLGHADEFVFRADLGDLQPIAGDWHLRIDRYGDAWVIWWAWTGRAWTRKRGAWLDSDAVDMALLAGPAGPVPWRDDILFGLAEALELVPRILEDLAERARKAVAGA